MNKTMSYTTIGLIISLLLVVIYSSFISNQRDFAINKLELANQQINQLITANASLKNTIQLLEKQDQQNRLYISQLNEKQHLSETQANQAQAHFKRAKNDNQIINDWANQPLPNGLYQ